MVRLTAGKTKIHLHNSGQIDIIRVGEMGDTWSDFNQELSILNFGSVTTIQEKYNIIDKRGDVDGYFIMRITPIYRMI